MKIKLLVIISVFCIALFAQDDSKVYVSVSDSVNPVISLTIGTVNGLESSRIMMRFYNDKYIVAAPIKITILLKLATDPTKKELY